MRSFQSAMNYLPDPVKLAVFTLFLGSALGALACLVGLKGLAVLVFVTAFSVAAFGEPFSPACNAAWAVVVAVSLAFAAAKFFF